VTTAIIAALVGALSATAAVAVAGTGVGGVFNLGQSNTVNQTSLLAGSTAADQLDVANLNTGSSARGLGVLGKSATAPAVAATNSGGGPALALTVNSGKSPFTVSSATKVVSLNADQLDGLDSVAFVQGAGTKTLSNSIHVNSGAAQQTLLTIPSLGSVKAQCHAQGADLFWVNDTGGNVDVWRDYGLIPGTDPVGFVSQVGINGSTGTVVHTYQTQQTGTTLGLAKGVQPGIRRLAVVHLLASQVAAHAQCGFQGVGTLWTNP
jgi:hypothetical protein